MHLQKHVLNHQLNMAIENKQQRYTFTGIIQAWKSRNFLRWCLCSLFLCGPLVSTALPSGIKLGFTSVCGTHPSFQWEILRFLKAKIHTLQHTETHSVEKNRFALASILWLCVCFSLSQLCVGSHERRTLCYIKRAACQRSCEGQIL